MREHAFELGLPGDVRMISRGEQVVLLREHMFELSLERYLPLGDPTRFLSALVDLFVRAKDEAVTPESFLAHAGELAARARDVGEEESAALADLAATRRELATAYAAYQRLLARRGLIDHGDQIALALRLLRERPALRDAVRARYELPRRWYRLKAKLLGVDAQRMEPVSFGEEKPRCTSHDESCWAQNRRGVFVYTAK